MYLTFMVLIKTQIKAGCRAISNTSVKLCTHQAMTYVCTEILGGLIRNARNLLSVAGPKNNSSLQKQLIFLSASCSFFFWEQQDGVRGFSAFHKCSFEEFIYLKYGKSSLRSLFSCLDCFCHSPLHQNLLICYSTQNFH